MILQTIRFASPVAVRDDESLRVMLNPDGTCNIRVVSATNAYSMDDTYIIVEPEGQTFTQATPEDATDG